jgi:hypothetical protein
VVSILPASTYPSQPPGGHHPGGGSVRHRCRSNGEFMAHSFAVIGQRALAGRPGDVKVAVDLTK